MVINDEQRHVREDGLVQIDYLNNWRTEFCLLDLITHLSAIFSEETPVYAKSANKANIASKSLSVLTAVLSGSSTVLSKFRNVVLTCDIIDKQEVTKK